MDELKGVDVSGQPGLSAGSGQSGDAVSPGWGDVTEFHAALNDGLSAAGGPGASLAPSSDAQLLLSKLGSLSSDIQERRAQTERAFVKASRSVDPEAMYQVTKGIEETIIETQLAVKVIVKVEQAVEQLTKLQ